MRREKAAIELHPFDDFNSRLSTTALFDRDHAVLADFDKGICENRTDRGVVVARDRGDLLDLFFAFAVDRS